LTWLHLALCLFLAVFFVYTIVTTITETNPDRVRSFGTAVMMLGALLGFNFYTFIRVLLPRTLSEFHLFDDRLEIHDRGRVVVAPFSDIAKVFGRVFPFIGGTYGFVMKSGQVFAFTASLERSERIIDALTAIEPNRKVGLAELRANLVVCGHSFARFSEYFRGTRGFVTFVHSILIPFVFSAYLVGRQAEMMEIHHPKPFFLGATFGIFLAVWTLAITFAITLNWMIDLPTLERLVDRPNEDRRDIERESEIFRDALPIYLFVLFSLLGVYNRFDLNTLSRTEVSADVPHLDLREGDRLWIDGRANCLQCRHALRQGDRILFNRDDSVVLGKLVALPGDPVPTVGGALGIRVPASDSPRVPPGKIVARSNPNGDLDQLVDLRDVRGRAEEDLAAVLRATD
jgi:hypothetical protein